MKLMEKYPISASTELTEEEFCSAFDNLIGYDLSQETWLSAIDGIAKGIDSDLIAGAVNGQTKALNALLCKLND